MRKAEMRPPAPSTDEKPTAIDFSKGIRGKFAKPGTKLVLPVYVDEEVQAEPAEGGHIRS